MRNFYCFTMKNHSTFVQFDVKEDSSRWWYRNRHNKPLNSFFSHDVTLQKHFIKTSIQKIDAKSSKVESHMEEETTTTCNVMMMTTMTTHLDTSYTSKLCKWAVKFKIHLLNEIQTPWTHVDFFYCLSLFCQSSREYSLLLLQRR